MADDTSPTGASHPQPAMKVSVVGVAGSLWGLIVSLFYGRVVILSDGDYEAWPGFVMVALAAFYVMTFVVSFAPVRSRNLWLAVVAVVPQTAALVMSGSHYLGAVYFVMIFPATLILLIPAGWGLLQRQEDGRR